MTGRLVARQDLTAADTAAMYELLQTHFAGVTATQFTADLAGKDWAILVEEHATLAGFSTLALEETEVDGEPLVVIHSGDTIVSPKAWGSAVFPRAWIHAVYALRQRHPTGRLIWLLLSSGPRTYRFLPVFWQTFFPRVNTPMPAEWNRLRNELAERRFGRLFHPEAGIVRFEQPQQLRGRLAEVTAGLQQDPDVAFFLKQNPGWRDGDELVCIADLDANQLTRAGRRVVYGTAK